jgi:hypothetical protein
MYSCPYWETFKVDICFVWKVHEIEYPGTVKIEILADKIRNKHLRECTKLASTSSDAATKAHLVQEIAIPHL